MAYLVPSLKAVFAELDSLWPNRDRKTDGWIGDSRHCPGTSDHCADSSGAVHAIDIDKDGIDPVLVINRLAEYPLVVRYMNYNYQQYHIKYDFVGRPLSGDPHTGHIHVSIHHTDQARNYTGGYGIARPVLPGIPSSIPGMPTTGEEVFDHSAHIEHVGLTFGELARILTEYSAGIASIRV